MITHRKSMLYLHLSVLLFGLAGIFGKLILLPAVIIVLGRVFFASIFLGLIMAFKNRTAFNIKSRKELIILLIMGAILAFHWFTFFYSIQISTVAIGLLTFSTFPVFTAFLEPWFLKEKTERIFIFIAILTFCGILLVVPEYKLDNTMTRGAVWGILSGLSFSFLIILNRKYISKISAIKIAFYQDTFSFFLLLPFLFFVNVQFQLNDLLLLLLLGTVFTAIAHYLYIQSLEKINARTASIISSLEPVYGILFALFIIHEIPTFKSLIGGFIIIGCSVFISLNKQGSKKTNK